LPSIGGSRLRGWRQAAYRALPAIGSFAAPRPQPGRAFRPGAIPPLAGGS